MNRRIVSIIVLCICFFAVSSIHAQANEVAKIDAKQLQSIVDSNKGKVIFINFFATWCPPCREEIPGLNALAKHYKDSEVMFIGLSVDKSAELVKPFVEELSINYPVYIAQSDAVYVYGVKSIPHNSIYDHKGDLVVNAPGYLQEEEIKKYIDNILGSKK